MQINPRSRSLFTGRTQAGKSHLVKVLSLRMGRVLIYDAKREYMEHGAIVHDVETLRKCFNEGCLRVVYQPLDVTPEHFDVVCGYVRQYLRNICFIVDEVHLFASKHKIPPNFKYILTVMQSMGVGVIAVTQRPANIHNDILGMSSLIVTFVLPLLADAKAISENTGIDATVIQTLPDRHFVVYDSRTGQSIKCLPV